MALELGYNIQGNYYSNLKGVEHIIKYYWHLIELREVLILWNTY